MFSMTKYVLHIIKRYKDRLGEGVSKITHWNCCRVCYRNGKCILSIFFRDTECVYVLMYNVSIKVGCDPVVINLCSLESKIHE